MGVSITGSWHGYCFEQLFFQLELVFKIKRMITFRKLICTGFTGVSSYVLVIIHLGRHPREPTSEADYNRFFLSINVFSLRLSPS